MWEGGGGKNVVGRERTCVSKPSKATVNNCLLFGFLFC